MLAVNGFVGISAQPHILAMCATGRTSVPDVSVRPTAISSNASARSDGHSRSYCRRNAHSNGAKIGDKESAFGYAALHLLGPGLIGLLVACILAANMSTCSNFMVNMEHSSHVISIPHTSVRLPQTGIAYRRPILRPRAHRVRHPLRSVRTAGAPGLSLHRNDRGLHGDHGGRRILWRRANRWGAAAACLAAFITYYAINHAAAGQWKLVYTWQPDHSPGPCSRDSSPWFWSVWPRRPRNPRSSIRSSIE